MIKTIKRVFKIFPLVSLILFCLLVIERVIIDFDGEIAAGERKEWRFYLKKETEVWGEIEIFGSDNNNFVILPVNGETLHSFAISQSQKVIFSFTIPEDNDYLFILDNTNNEKDIRAKILVKTKTTKKEGK